jgi:amino-acid N-acetyltransferase
MEIVSDPSIEAVHRLLLSTGLPVDDITEAGGISFFGLGSGEILFGVIGIEIHGPFALLRSLAVSPLHRGDGLGRILVDHLERFAADRSITDIYLLTTTAEDYFHRVGYRPLPKAEAPAAIKKTSEFSLICPDSAVLMAKSISGR